MKKKSETDLNKLLILCRSSISVAAKGRHASIYNVLRKQVSELGFTIHVTILPSFINRILFP